MGLIDFLTRFHKDSYKQSDEIKDFKTKHPEFAAVDDTKLAGALSKKYPSQYGHLADFKPESATPAEQVPNEKRTKEFYQKNPSVAPQKTGSNTIQKVKAKYPEFADVEDEKLAKALETKYPDRFPKLTEIVINEKFGSLTAAPERKPNAVMDAIDFLAQKTKLDVYKPDPKADAAATMALSGMTGLPPHEVAKLSTAERRHIAMEKTGVATQPGSVEFTQGLAMQAALLFGAQTPAALLSGVVKLQALHTAIGQAVKLYKGETALDPEKTASFGANVEKGNVVGAAGDVFNMLNDSDISKLASNNATAQERDLLELLQFGAEIGVVHMATPELTAKLRAGLKETGKAAMKAGEAGMKAAQEFPAKAQEMVANASENVRAAAKVVSEIPENVRLKLGEEKAFVDAIRAKNPKVNEAGAKTLYKEFKNFQKNIEAEGGGSASSDWALRQLTGGAVNRPVSGIVQKAGEVMKPGVVDVKPTDIISAEHARIRGYEVPKDFAGASEAQFKAMIDKGIVKKIEAPVVKETAKPAEAAKPASDGIPTFKNTNEAVAFGKANSGKPEVLSALAARAAALQPRIDALKEKKDTASFQEGYNLSVEKQFYNEAAQAATPDKVETEQPAAELEAKVHPETVKKLTAAIEAKDLDALNSILHAENKVSRKIFTERTGVELPAGAEATRQVLRDFAKPDEEYERVSDKYHAFNVKEGKFEEAKNAKSFEVEGVEVFVHKHLDGKGYTVSEAKSGASTGSGKTIQAALEAARTAFKTVGAEKTREAITRSIKRSGLSPRYKVREKSAIEPELRELAEEAKQHPTAAAFVKAKLTKMKKSFSDSFTPRSIQVLRESGIDVSSPDQVLTLYHGTSGKGAKGIEKDGLNVNSYLASDPKAAAMFAGGRGGSVIEIKVPVNEAGSVSASTMAGTKGVTVVTAMRLRKGADGVWRISTDESPDKPIPGIGLKPDTTATEFFKKVRGEQPVKTQKEKVKEAVADKPKDIKTVAQETGILEPNVRRILGVGAKEGVFTRVDKGVYTVSVGEKKLAYVYAADAVEALPKLVAEGFKADMVFLDIPYVTAANKPTPGRNRNLSYELISPDQFKSVMQSISAITRTDDTPVFYMYSQAASGVGQMKIYTDAVFGAGFKPIARGFWKKTYKDGSPVLNVRGKVAAAEGILLLSKSGNLPLTKIGDEDLQFTFQRPRGYQSQKPAEMLERMIKMTTEEGDTVLDPFAGSGVTAVEAVKAGRTAVAIEKNPEQAGKIAEAIEAAAPAPEKAPEIAVVKGMVIQQGDKQVFVPMPEGVRVTQTPEHLKNIQAARPVLEVGDILKLGDEEGLSDEAKLIVTKIEQGRVSYRDYSIDADAMLKEDMRRKAAGEALLTPSEIPLEFATITGSFNMDGGTKVLYVERGGKEIFKKEVPKKSLKQYVAEEKAKAPAQEAPSEKALKYETGKRVEPWQVLEKDYIERRRKQHLDYYAKRLAELRKEKQTKKVADEIMAMEFWQKKYSEPTFHNSEKSTYAKEVKTAISKGAPVPAEVVAQYPEFRTARDARERYEKGKHTSFANRSIAVDDTMQAERGYKVKRQDGTEMTEKQKKEIADGVSEIEEVMGSLKQVFQDADITFSHTNGTHPFLNNAGGLWIPSENTITIGIKIIGIFPVKAQAHEVGHAIDYLAGGVLGKQSTVYGNATRSSYARKRLGSITALSEADGHRRGSEGTLIREAYLKINNPQEVKRLINTELKEVAGDQDAEVKVRGARISLGDYWDSPREIWARLTEQYVAFKRNKPGVSHDNIESYYNQAGYWTKDDFAKLLPLYEKELARRLSALRTTTPTEAAIRSIGAETDAVLEKISKAKQTGAVLLDGEGELPHGSSKRVNDDVQVIQSLNPDVEARWKAAKGLKEEGLVGKIWQGIKGIYTQFHEFPELPPGDPSYSQVKYDLRILRDLKQIAQDKTLRALNQILFTLGEKKLDLFTRKVILDDLMFEAGRGHLLPFGYTNESLAADHEHIGRIVSQNPDVQASLELRRKLLDAVKKDLIDAGIMDAEQFRNTNYFRHQVLEYANARRMLTGSKLKTPNPAYAKRRGGSEMDINTDYIQAEFEWLSQAIKDIEVAKVVERLEQSPLNIKKSLQDQAKATNDELLNSIELTEKHDALIPKKLLELRDEKGIKITAQAVMKEFSNKMGWGFGNLNRLGYKINEEDGGAGFAEVGRIADEGEGEPEDAQIAARMILKAIGDRKKFIRAVLGGKFVVWQDLIPETHEAWQPKKGNLFFSGKTIPQRLIDKLISEEGAAVGLSASDLKDVVILGGKLKEFVLPKGLVKTIEETYSTMNDTEVDKLWQLIFRAPTSFWKKWILSSPFGGRIVSYQFQNMLGDLSAVIGGNPQVVLKAPGAARELWNYYYGQGSVSPELQDAIDRAVLTTELSVQEIPDINHLDVFERFNDKSFVDKVNVVKIWFAGAAKFSKWREGVLRYASYLDYLEKQGTEDYGAGIGRAFKYGASDPDMVKGLADPKDRAAQLARDLLGDYGAISPIGQSLRKFLFPFWSWNEVNIKRYKRLFSNARMEGLGGGEGGDGGKARVVGATGFAMSAMTAAFALRWAFRFAIIYLMQQAWNNLVHPDLEQDISEYDKRRGHIIIGKNSKGEIIMRRGQDAFSDFAEWFGLNKLPALMARISNKEITPIDAGLEMAKSPVNKFINGINPYVKTGVALMTRRTFFDDFTKPMPVRDGAALAADQFQVRGLYNFAANKPTRGAKDEVVRSFVTKQDPEENAYNYILQRKGEFKESLGFGGSGDFFTPRSTLYYDYKKARKLGDTEAAKRAVAEMKKLGVKQSDLDRSLAAAKPLWGVPKEKQKEFVYKFLTEQDRRKLVMANAYYKKTFLKKE